MPMLVARGGIQSLRYRHYAVYLFVAMGDGYRARKKGLCLLVLHGVIPILGRGEVPVMLVIHKAQMKRDEIYVNSK